MILQRHLCDPKIRAPESPMLWYSDASAQPVRGRCWFRSKNSKRRVCAPVGMVPPWLDRSRSARPFFWCGKCVQSF